MRHIKKPLVAGISGYAAASGFELALMCDLRVMEETAQFAMLNRRYGKNDWFIRTTDLIILPTKRHYMRGKFNFSKYIWQNYNQSLFNLIQVYQ